MLMRCGCAGQIEMRTRRSKLDANAQFKITCACAGEIDMRMRRPKCDVHAETKMISRDFVRS